MKQENQVTCRFYEELNDFLPSHRRKKEFTYHYRDARSIKDLIESLGVPHTEVELILVNSKSVDFNYQVKNNDRISVYPMFEALDISSDLKLRLEPLRDIKFVLDCHLGKLAKYLRMAGFDTLYQNDYQDHEIALISSQRKRILLTRDRDLLKRKIIDHAYYVRQFQPQKQLLEIIKRFDLLKQVKPFTRCIHCNGKLSTVEKSCIEAQLEPGTRQFYQHFKQCRKCHKIYWQGNHYEDMQKILNSITFFEQ
jgi:uncharacterized protein with PIN domain